MWPAGGWPPDYPLEDFVAAMTGILSNSLANGLILMILAFPTAAAGIRFISRAVNVR